MIRVLHVFNKMGNGGIEHYVMDRYRLIDRSKLQFDFLITSESKGYFDEEVLRMGGRVFHTTDFAKKPFQSLQQTKRIVKENNYNIVHRHTGNAVAYADLLAARSGGAEHLIIHSHSSSAGRMIIHKVSRKILTFDCIRIACSNSAGEWLFGDKPFIVMNNGVDTLNYSFNEDTRNRCRKAYGISDGSFVVGHIGRVESQKNHTYLIDVFCEICKVKPESVLMCIGDGSLRESIEKKSRELGIDDRIIWTGTINNVNEVINCFDVFCLPSIYEGFPISLVEAQANGLKCFAAENSVSKETDISGNVIYISLEKTEKEWADQILNTPPGRDMNAVNSVINAGYDLCDTAKKLEKFYLSIEGEYSS